MLNSGKKYSNSCVVGKQISVRNKNHNPPPPPPHLQVKWSVPKVYGLMGKSLSRFAKVKIDVHR